MLQDEHAIRVLIDRWHKLTAAGDVAGVLSLMTEDAMFLIPGKPPMSGKADFETGLRAVLQASRIESAATVEEVFVSGDLAYAMTSLSVKVIPRDGSKANERFGRALSLFVRTGHGIWLLKRDANLLGSAR